MRYRIRCRNWRKIEWIILKTANWNNKVTRKFRSAINNATKENRRKKNDTNLIGVNNEKEPLTGMSPVRLLFDRSLHLTYNEDNVTFLQYSYCWGNQNNKTYGKCPRHTGNFMDRRPLSGKSITVHACCSNAVKILPVCEIGHACIMAQKLIDHDKTRQDSTHRTCSVITFVKVRGICPFKVLLLRRLFQATETIILQKTRKILQSQNNQIIHQSCGQWVHREHMLLQ